MISFDKPTDTYQESILPRVLNASDVEEQFPDFYYHVKLVESGELITESNLHCQDTLADVNLLKGLPNTVLAYRGAHKSEAITGYGQSWTLCEDVAKFFAFELYSTWSFKNKPEFDPANRLVHVALVPRDSIMVYINNRNEYECILQVKPETYIVPVTLTGTE